MSTIAGRRRKKRPQCPQCGSRKFRKDADTGFVVCWSGHILQGFREEEANDGEDFSASQLSQMRKRYLHKEKPSHSSLSKKKRSTAAQGTWYGAKARYLSFQCLQLLLRLQVSAIKREMAELPREFEQICRELWTMYVSLQTDLVTPSNAPDEDDRQEDWSSNMPFKSRRADSLQRASVADEEAMLDEEDDETFIMNRNIQEMDIDERDESNGPYEASDSSHHQPTTYEGFESATDRTISTEDDNSVHDEKSRKSHSKRRMRRSSRHMLSLISILSLALLMLRIPFQWSDFRKLIMARRLPYLQALHSLPDGMTKPLPLQEIRKFDIQSPPTVMSMYQHTLGLAKDLHSRFDVQFPVINAFPLLLRSVEHMLLPPTFYVAAKRILSYIKIPINAVPDECTNKKEASESDDEVDSVSMKDPRLEACLQVTLGRRSVPREVIFMATVILVARLRYGLDGVSRQEVPDVEQIWSGAPALTDWLQALEKSERSEKLDVAAVYDPCRISLLDMDEEYMDAYLKYAEQYLIPPSYPSLHEWRQRQDIDDLLSCAPDIAALHPIRNKEDNQASSESGGRLLYTYRNELEGALGKLYEAESMPNRAPRDSNLMHNKLRPGDAYEILAQTTPGHPIRSDTHLLHPSLQEVLRHGSRLIDCDVDLLFDTLQAVETGLTRLLTHRRNFRQSVEKEERQRLGKRKPGRPRKRDPRT